MKARYLIIFIALGALSLVAQKGEPASDGLALTPPMGWNSWNKFACDVNEDMIRSMADAMVKSGMKDAGYEYINVDDCWQVSRDANGNIVADPQRFPHGMKALGDYIHSLGLKFGVYSDAGSKTCAGRPGGLGHEYQDALQYATWGVDYLKYDWCNTTTQDAQASYANIRSALDATGRHIVLSICEWGTAKPWLWEKKSVEICGAPPVTSATDGQARTSGRMAVAARIACSRSSTCRSAWGLTPAPDIGMTPTCSRLATEE